MNKIEAAKFIAKLAHRGQVDKSGRDYIYHPLTVMSFCESEEEKIVALLHDTIEDTIVTREDIENIFGKEIGDAVHTMTHKEGMDYFDYVKEIKKNPIARAVKLADLRHNMDVSRLGKVTEKDLQRVEKYKKAKEILES